MTPEQEARIVIDNLLTAAGWVIQDYRERNLGAGVGVAIREYPLRTGYADYLLFVNRQAVGAVEAKAAGTTLSGINHQTNKYSEGLPERLPAPRRPLPFLYESTGVETRFTNTIDPDPRSRPLFAFHKPETLAAWLAEPSTLRARLRTLPPLMPESLWAHQLEAITNLEQSLAENKPRALIQMTMGSGKTVTAINAVYRQIKFGGAKRVLFLVDRSSLGIQAYQEFVNFRTPDTNGKFGEIYNVQRLESNRIDPTSTVVITTIQRLYSILSGETQFDASNEELPESYKTGDPRTVAYSSALPIEFFDAIVIDECHRSIYKLWRQVLEYFDAFLTGLTATPHNLTLGFFNQNLVMEYTRRRAVADNVNVDGQVWRIETEITSAGSTIKQGMVVGKMDRRTRAKRWETTEEQIEYEGAQLDRDVVSESQIRTVIRAYRDSVLSDIYPGREEVPKTLIFAKDDNHAENIVNIVREEFGKGNDFCQKITYRVTGKSPQELIAEFRTGYSPRIAVTVDLVATGTDIRPLEVVFFMRMVKSSVLYEQMLGRATRVVSPTDLKTVSPSADRKDRFVIVDAVGVTEQEFAPLSAPLERDPSVSLERLLGDMADGAVSEDALSTLAVRLLRLAPRLDDATTAELQELNGGYTLQQIAANLLNAMDPDAVDEAARQRTGGAEPTEADLNAVTVERMRTAAQHFDNAVFRRALLDARARLEMTIDVTSIDRVTQQGFTEDGARETVASFKEYLEQHKDEIDALQILYSRPYGTRRLTFAAIQRLFEELRKPPNSWTIEQLWRAYERLEADKVHGAGAKRQLTDLVSLVRHAVGVEEELIPFPDVAQRRYSAWLSDQQAAGRAFTQEQRWWLDRIAEQIGVDLEVTPRSLQNVPALSEKGGVFAAKEVLGSDWPGILEELNGALVPTGGETQP